jgi:hypothetical protein
MDDCVSYSGSFEDAIAWRLAVELAMALRQDAKLANSCLQAYHGTVADAMCQELRGRQDDPEAQAPSIQARTGLPALPGYPGGAMTWPWVR